MEWLLSTHTLLLFCAIFFVCGFVVAWLVAKNFLRPPWQHPSKPGEQLSQHWPAVAWGPHLHDPKTNFELDFDNVEFPAHDGSTLRGWYVPSQGHEVSVEWAGAHLAEYTGVVLVHGAGRDRRAFMRHVPMFYARGLDALLFDCRGHGQSDGPHLGVSYGHRESEDVMAAVEFMRDVKGFKRIVVVGTSQGAAASIIAAAGSPKEFIDVVVAENPFCDQDVLVDQVLEKIPRRFCSRRVAKLFYPVWMIWSAIARMLIRRRMRQVHQTISDLREERHIDEGASSSRKRRGSLSSPMRMVMDVEQPLLIMHAKGDSLIPHHHSEELYSLAVHPKEIWIVEGSEHCALYNTYPEEWEERVFSFIEKHVAPV